MPLQQELKISMKIISLTKAALKGTPEGKAMAAAPAVPGMMP